MTGDPDPPRDPSQHGPDDESLTRTITAILASDVAGYTRMIADDEEGTLRRFAEYCRIFREAVARNKGRVFNTAGDAILAEFPSAVLALRCALEVQETLRARNEDLPPPERLQFRMGVNVGDVVDRGGDLLGDGVNVAARLEGLAEPGGICITGSVHDAVGNKVTARYRDLGRQRLKNIAQPVQVYRVRPASDARTERSARRSLLVGSVLALLLGGGGFAGWLYRDSLRDVWPFKPRVEAAGVAATQLRTALSVSVARPERRCFQDTVRVTGRFLPRREVEVRPDGEGLRVTRVLASPLGQVAKGDVLAQVVPAADRDAAEITVRAPVAGVVGRSNAQVDMPASFSGPALFTLIPDGEMEFVADVPAGGLERLGPGQSVSLTGLGLAPIGGRIRTVSRPVDGASQLGRATVTVDRHPELRWGLFGRGMVQVGESCGLAVPLASVMYEGDQSAVYVSANNLVEPRPVVVGLSSESEVEIRSGLGDADMVIQRAGPFLREGDRITPITGERRTAAAPR
ncbi:HlyD family efflux transporter periplasmic adaptor subunit [Enterovirga sp.]|uniref:HlyD family efflux transporter periplasmic adaptor subunit n=1 Tax=Enterovirga sp. TaxID=2026350 RepID=UPI002624C1B2|nr:HlyD family efflux transporter periplasmic adaptor subunit [Enterovirga sp.]MDB5592350.1 hypothetical protein [Enterovirga sp.]